MHVWTEAQEAVLGWCFPTDNASHSCSHAAFVEVSYGVSWVAKGHWQPIWCAWTSEGQPVAQNLVMSCTWS